MKHNKRGFTLIELLVVVLIIGILSAIALPQYQIAVARSKLMGYFPVARSLAQAQEIYYMTNGYYATKLSDLDVQIPEGCTYLNDGVGNAVRCGADISIDNYLSGNLPVGCIIVKYCPGKATSIQQCAAYVDAWIFLWLSHVTFSTKIPNTFECGNKTALGKNICNSLKGIVD